MKRAATMNARNLRPTFHGETIMPLEPSHQTKPPSSSPRFARVNGLHMYYEDVGQGRPLLLLHGGGSTAQTSFGALIPALSRRHRVIAPEQQAHGHTGDIDRALTFAQMADDTAELLRQLDVMQVDVMGFSAGSMVALQLAIRHPSLVRQLVLCSPFYSRDGFPPGFWEGMAQATPDSMPKGLREAFLQAAGSPADVPRMFARQVSLMQAFTDLPEAALRAIESPALVMLGDADVMPVEHAVRLARLLPRAQLAVMPGSGHGAYLGAVDAQNPGSRQPELTTVLIEEFLDGTR